MICAISPGPYDIAFIEVKLNNVFRRKKWKTTEAATTTTLTTTDPATTTTTTTTTSTETTTSTAAPTTTEADAEPSTTRVHTLPPNIELGGDKDTKQNWDPVLFSPDSQAAKPSENNDSDDPDIVHTGHQFGSMLNLETKGPILDEVKGKKFKSICNFIHMLLKMS